MIKGLSAVSIWSADLNNLLPFYRDVLGLEVALQSPRRSAWARTATSVAATPTRRAT